MPWAGTTDHVSILFSKLQEKGATGVLKGTLPILHIKDSRQLLRALFHSATLSVEAFLLLV